MSFLKNVPLDRYLAILSMAGLLGTWIYSYAATASDVEKHTSQIEMLTGEFKELRDGVTENGNRLTGVETKVDGIGKSTDEIKADIRRLTDMIIRRNIAPNGSSRNPG